MRIQLLLIILFLSSTGCSTILNTAFSLKTAHLTKEVKAKRARLQIPKKDHYKITTVIKYSQKKLITYTTQTTLVYKKENGNILAESTRSINQRKDFREMRDVESGKTWAYQVHFKGPIQNGEFMVMVGDSTVYSQSLKGRKTKIDYGFELP